MSSAKREPAEPPGLTDFQLEVARTFFDLPASEGFLLAGGGALLANGLTQRPTQDLDFFRSSPDVVTARDAFEAAATDRGWRVARLWDYDDFVRLQIEGAEPLMVDLCLDSPPTRPAVATVAGPTFDPDELAGRKVAALFSRAEARDFADVHALLERYTRERLLALAREVDLGFDEKVFAEMLCSIDRHDDAPLETGGASAAHVRSTFAAWVDVLRS